MATEYCTIGVEVCLSPEAWAAWVQAILTVATFVGTVLYQASQNRKADRLRIEAEKRSQEQIDRFKHAEIQEQYLTFSRFLRRWILVSEEGLSADLTDPGKSKQTLEKTIKALAEVPSPAISISKFGPLSTAFAGLLYAIEGFIHEANNPKTNYSAIDVEATWKVIDAIAKKCKSALDSGEKVMDNESLDVE